MAEPTDQSNSFYGVISARVSLSTMAAASVLGENRWDDRVLQVMLANFRTTGRFGLRPSCHHLSAAEPDDRQRPDCAARRHSYWNQYDPRA